MAKTGQGWGKKNHCNGLRSNRPASVADLAVNSVVASLEFLTTGSILVPERAQHYPPNCSASKVSPRNRNGVVYTFEVKFIPQSVSGLRPDVRGDFCLLALFPSDDVIARKPVD